MSLGICSASVFTKPGYTITITQRRINALNYPAVIAGEATGRQAV